MASTPGKKMQAAPAAVKKVSDITYAWIVTLLAFLLYVNTLGHDYTVDDGTVIKNNKFTTAGISSLPKIFSTAYRAGYWERKEGLYRPLSVAMFAVEWQLAPEKPWLGHTINVLLYALTAWCLFLFLRKLLHKLHQVIPFIITVLYIVHPVHTEVVANIKSRDEILCFLFAVLAMNAVMKWVTSGRALDLIPGAVFYFLALMSKESAITLVAVFPMLIWFFTDQPVKRLSTVIFVFLGTGLAFVALRYAVIGAVAGNYELQLINNTLVGAKGAGERFGTALYIMAKYLGLLIAPVTLVFDYSYNTIPVISLTDIKALGSLLLYGVIIWLAVKGFMKKESWAFGILFFGATISLVSNLLFLIEATMAERFLYMPSLGFCIAAVTGVMTLMKNVKIREGGIGTQLSTPLMMVFTVVSVLYSFRTLARNADWKDNLTLLSKDVKSSPNSARIRYAYGSAILVEQALKEEDKNRKQELLRSSINELEMGVSIIEDYSDAWYHLGVAYKEANDPANAIRCFEKARSYKPFNDAEKYIAIGLAYGMANQFPKAIDELKQAVRLDDKSTEGYNNLGLYYNDAGDFKSSVEALQKALELNPAFSKAWYNLGNTYAKSGDYKTAIEKYQKAISLDAGYGDAYNNVGNCYAAMQRTDSAKVYYEKAVAIDPSNVKAVINIGVMNNQLGDTAAARMWFDKARALGAAL